MSRPTWYSIGLLTFDLVMYPVTRGSREKVGDGGRGEVEGKDGEGV